MELLSLTVLIDSLVFMSNAKGSISSISRGLGAAAMTHFFVSVFLLHVLSLSFLVFLLFKNRLGNINSTGAGRHFPILKGHVQTTTKLCGQVLVVWLIQCLFTLSY